MRELTFRGFLTQYVKHLSVQETTSLYKLAKEASSTNPRLKEPLFLYALFSQKKMDCYKQQKHLLSMKSIIV